jgi:hypothetical protein
MATTNNETMNFTEWEQKKAIICAVRDWGYLCDFYVVVSDTSVWFNSEINRDFRDNPQFWSYRIELPDRRMVDETMSDSATWFDYGGRTKSLKTLLSAIADDFECTVIHSRSLEDTNIKPDKLRLYRYKKALGL